MADADTQARVLTIEFVNKRFDLAHFARLVRHLDLLAGDATHLNLYRRRATVIPPRPQLRRPEVTTVEMHSPLHWGLTGADEVGEALTILWFVLHQRRVLVRLIPDMIRHWREAWDEQDAARWRIEKRRAERDQERARVRAEREQADRELDLRLTAALHPPAHDFTRGRAPALQTLSADQVAVLAREEYPTDTLSKRTISNMKRLRDVAEPTKVTLDPPPDPLPPWLPPA